MEPRRTYLLGSPVPFTYVLAILEHSENLFNSRLLLLELLHFQALAASPCLFDKFLERLFDELNILEAQLLGDDV